MAPTKSIGGIAMIVGILVGLFVICIAWNLLKGVLRLVGGLLVILFVIAAIGFAVTSIGRF